MKPKIKKLMAIVKLAKEHDVPPEVFLDMVQNSESLDALGDTLVDMLNKNTDKSTKTEAFIIKTDSGVITIDRSAIVATVFTDFTGHILLAAAHTIKLVAPGVSADKSESRVRTDELKRVRHALTV